MPRHLGNVPAGPGEDGRVDPTEGAGARWPLTVPPDVAGLLRQAAGSSGLLWLDLPGDRAWPAWHVWLDDTGYVVSGPGEQTLPALPGELLLVLRSKETGGRLLTVRAKATTLTPADERWDAATAALRASRLNSPGGQDVVARWAAQCTVTALLPYGLPIEYPGSYDAASGAAPPAATPATTTARRRSRTGSFRGRAHGYR